MATKKSFEMEFLFIRLPQQQVASQGREKNKLLHSVRNNDYQKISNPPLPSLTTIGSSSDKSITVDGSLSP